ncbi:MAG: LysM peptidoglycan-binding domain-containing protein, partial [Chloroflexi bacterium]|nr:LysM peptidoglycan-binding domain-containing protein [Chloroflexota bacterium]
VGRDSVLPTVGRVKRNYEAHSSNSCRGRELLHAWIVIGCEREAQMMNKKTIQIIVLIAVTLVSISSTGTALAYSCGTSYTVQRGDTLSQVAQTCGTSVSAINLANPGLGKFIYAGQVLMLPGAFWDNGNGYATYIVARGDTLKSLASRFGASMDTIASLNGITNYNLIYEGQRLTVPNASGTPPPSGGRTYTVQSGDTLRKIAGRLGTTVNDILAVNPQITDQNLIYTGQVINIPTAASYYTVQSGDTMKKIAARFGVTLESLISLNPQIADINKIYVGQVIRIW